MRGYKGRAVQGLVVLFLAMSSGAAFGAFDRIGVGARAVGLGQAFVAIADDPNTLFYNPAGLQLIRRIGLSSMYARLYPQLDDPGIHYSSLAAVFPQRLLGYLGVGLQHLAFGNYRETIFSVGYARALPLGFSLGGTLKWLRWEAEGYQDPQTGLRDRDFSFGGISLDVGVLFKIQGSDLPLLRRYLSGGFLQVGVALFDFTEPSIASGSPEAKLRRTLMAGIAYRSPQITMALSLSRWDGWNKLHVGVEYDLMKGRALWGLQRFYLRGGGIRVLTQHKGGEIDVGFGLLYWKFHLDYAHVIPLALKRISGSHKISVGYAF